MSNSSNSNWKTVNEMLRNDQIDLNQPTSSVTLSVEYPGIRLIFKDTEGLNKGFQLALKNFQEIARLEYEFNGGQPEKITLKHLKWAQVYIESGMKAKKNPNMEPVLNALSYVSIGEVLLECYLLVQQDQSKGFCIDTDANRIALVSFLFGDNRVAESLSTPIEQRESDCTQIIFESADVASAIDELIANLSDQTMSPWRIESVYVQESLRNTVLDLLTVERLNAAYSTAADAMTSENKRLHAEELANKFGGKLVSNKNGTIYLLFDVPPKYIQSDNIPLNKIPIAVNFFRTTKEAIQLAKSKASSIWTENIEIFYEVATELNAEIIWSNAVGEFDKCMPSLDQKIDSIQSEKR